MNADTLAGEPLYLQGVAVAGLRDSANAVVLTTEAVRLDGLRHIAAKPSHALLLQHVTTLARKKCG